LKQQEDPYFSPRKIDKIHPEYLVFIK